MAEAKNIRLYAPDGARIEDASLAADYLAALAARGIPAAGGAGTAGSGATASRSSR